MALTGMPEETPAISPAPALAMLGQVTAELARVTRETGRQVRADPAELITGRAALAGLTRGGRVSAGGSSFLLPSADGWCAVTLSLPDDWAAAPAIAGALGLNRASLDGASLDAAGLDGTGPEEIVTRARARAVLAAAALSGPAEDFAAAAQLAGVPAAALPAARSSKMVDRQPQRGVASDPPSFACGRRPSRPAAAESSAGRASADRLRWPAAGRRGGPRASRRRWPAHGWPARWSLTCHRCGQARCARACSAWRARRSSRSSRRPGPTGRVPATGSSTTGCMPGTAASALTSPPGRAVPRSRRCLRRRTW